MEIVLVTSIAAVILGICLLLGKKFKMQFNNERLEELAMETDIEEMSGSTMEIVEEKEPPKEAEETKSIENPEPEEERLPEGSASQPQENE